MPHLWSKQVQWGEIEIPCFYEIRVKKGVKGYGSEKNYEKKHEQLVPTTDNTVERWRAHPCGSNVKLERQILFFNKYFYEFPSFISEKELSRTNFI